MKRLSPLFALLALVLSTLACMNDGDWGGRDPVAPDWGGLPPGTPWDEGGIIPDSGANDYSGWMELDDDAPTEEFHPRRSRPSNGARSSR